MKAMKSWRAPRLRVWIALMVLASPLGVGTRAAEDPLERAIRRDEDINTFQRAMTNALEDAERRKEWRRTRPSGFDLLSNAEQEDAVRNGLATPKEVEQVLQRKRPAGESPEARAENWSQGATLPDERSGSGGTITARGKTVTIARGETMPATKRGEPPTGMVWVFSETSAQPWALAEPDPADMTEDQAKAAEAASYKRVLDRYPFLADKADPRRALLEEFIASAAESPRYEVMFTLTSWREYAADECALLHGWPKTARDFSKVFAPSSQTAAAEAPSKAPSAKESKPAAAKTHWITNSSGIRHNSKCKHYENSRGRPCTKDEGRACKICGG